MWQYPRVGPGPADHPTPDAEEIDVPAASDPSPTTVRLERRRLLVDGVPRILMAGEVHYFRLHREDWADRLDKLVESGCDAVASYMPWLVHETAAGEVDLTGETSEYRDLVGFLDLAAERGLLVIARPGPFVMAELKNEGVPYRIYREHPAAIPIGWDGEPAPSATLDYVEPGYLAAAERWYAAIMPVLAERLVTRGGPVAAVQIDNEVGMLSWVTNTPELTDSFLTGLAADLDARWGREAVIDRYGADPKDTDAWTTWWRAGGTAGSETQQLAVHHELSAYHRERYATYLRRLHAVARDHGVDDVPFMVNLHGTGMGRGKTFAIGISQLSQAYAGVPQMTAGSDHYLGELTAENVPDLYVDEQLHGVRAGRRPAADVAGVRGGHRRLRRGPEPAHQPRDDRAQDPALPGPGQPADQLLPVRRRPQPAARRAVGRRQRPDRVHRRTARLRGADRPGGTSQHRRSRPWSARCGRPTAPSTCWPTWTRSTTTSCSATCPTTT